MPSASEPGLAVRVDGLSVVYRTPFDRRPTIRGTLAGMGRRRRGVRVVEALRDVSFEVRQGSVLGVVGPNGAGKSTTLRAIAGIVPPAAGRIELYGEVSTLLALGVGFNGNLSGRENVLLGGLAQGMSPGRVAERFDDIVAFAGVEERIDDPVRTYSSGMYQRLAFSVAVHMEPDILLVDEALSAGDAQFRLRAAGRMRELIAQARSIVLVSHGLALVRELATRCIWLEGGRLLADGEPGEVIDAYLRRVEGA